MSRCLRGCWLWGGMTSHASHWQGTASHVLWAQGLARADLPSKRLRCVRGEQRHLRALSTPPLPAPPRGSLPCLRLSCPRRFQVGTASFLCSPRGVPHHHAEGLAEGGARGLTELRGPGWSQGPGHSHSQGRDSCAESRLPNPVSCVSGHPGSALGPGLRTGEAPAVTAPHVFRQRTSTRCRVTPGTSQVPRLCARHGCRRGLPS